MLNWCRNMFSSKYKILTISLIVVFASVAGIVIAQKETNKIDSNENLEPLPKGKGSITFHPYLGDGYLDAPVIVQSVSSKRANVAKFEIQNISSKSIKAIKVRWNLYEDQDRSKFKQMGQTKRLDFRENLLSEKIGFIKYEVVSFVDFYRNQLDSKGELNKNLDIDVLVDEVFFADGSIWRWEDGRSLDIKQDFVESLMNVSDCAKQRCVGKPSSKVRDGISYSCGTSDLTERCVPDGDYACTNQSCNRPSRLYPPNKSMIEKDYEIIID
jgi:hypothetical protein